MTDNTPENPSDIKPCVCLAMVVADNVIQEAGTGKSYVLGTFSRIFSAQYPARHDRFHLYVAIADGRPGEHTGQIRVDYLDGERMPLLEAHGPIVVKNRLDVIELNFCFRGVVFPRPGSLEIGFYFDQTFISARKFELALAGSQEPQNAG